MVALGRANKRMEHFHNIWFSAGPLSSLTIDWPAPLRRRSRVATRRSSRSARLPLRNGVRQILWRSLVTVDWRRGATRPAGISAASVDRLAKAIAPLHGTG